jgi:centromeric protein E
VISAEQVFALVAAGEAHRHIGSTEMNANSSRSHTIFRLVIESKALNSGAKSKVRVSTLSLVDLAGSESVKSTHTSGDRQNEGKFINKSLLTLGKVIWKLSEGSR